MAVTRARLGIEGRQNLSMGRKLGAEGAGALGLVNPVAGLGLAPRSAAGGGGAWAGGGAVLASNSSMRRFRASISFDLALDVAGAAGAAAGGAVTWLGAGLAGGTQAGGAP